MEDIYIARVRKNIARVSFDDFRIIRTESFYFASYFALETIILLQS